MDRAHRVGQTKQVTVYRLIARGTIEERIVKLARAKKDVSALTIMYSHYPLTLLSGPRHCRWNKVAHRRRQAVRNRFVVHGR